MADVKHEAVDWIWRGRIPLGKVSIIAGPPGTSKSLLTIDVAARVTTGAAFPDTPDSATPCGRVILLNAEDDPADTIKPRLLAAGADVNRVEFVNSVGRGIGRVFSLKSNLRDLERRIKKHRDVRMVILDPLGAFMGGIDSHRDAAVREVLGPLTSLAAKHKVAVVVVMHLNKARRRSALERLNGSIGFGGAARSVMLVAADPAEPERRVVALVKSNLAGSAPPIAYRIRSAPIEGAGDAPALEWDDQAVSCDLPALLEGMGSDGASPSEEQKALQWLRDQLKNGTQTAQELVKRAKEAGFSRSTIKRAKKQARIESKKQGEQWIWSMPQPQAAPA